VVVVVLLIACMHGVESRDGERGASSSVCLPILAGREKRYPSSLETPNCVRTEQTDRPLRWSLLYRSFSLMLIPIDRWLWVRVELGCTDVSGEVSGEVNWWAVGCLLC
jgi:hypothetical protein